MSVSWGVIPVVPEIYEWLAQSAYEVNGAISRYPTIDELWQVLQSFDNLPAGLFQSRQSDWRSRDFQSRLLWWQQSTIRKSRLHS